MPSTNSTVSKRLDFPLLATDFHDHPTGYGMHPIAVLCLPIMKVAFPIYTLCPLNRGCERWESCWGRLYEGWEYSPSLGWTYVFRPNGKKFNKIIPNRTYAPQYCSHHLRKYSMVTPRNPHEALSHGSKRDATFEHLMSNWKEAAQLRNISQKIHRIQLKAIRVMLIK